MRVLDVADSSGTRSQTVLKNFNGWEIIIVLLIVVLLFGARKLPDLARSIGASAKEFRKGLDSGMDDEEKDA
ncbi:MAG: twin-arginine translocase TatA/TatE family subunit [bacterium]|nr:twin-arginine translocase TatA/TatE family subunit [bacterium]